MKTPVAPAKDGIYVNLYVQPGAANSAWCGVMDGALKLRISARPFEGAANKEVCNFVAIYLGVSNSAVSITQGRSARRKVIHVSGASEILMAKLSQLIEGQGI